MSIIDEWVSAMHARQAVERTPAMDDPIAPVGPFSYVRGTRGGPLDVPVEAFRSASKRIREDGRVKGPKTGEFLYSKPADTCMHCGRETVVTHVACYVEANRGCIQKGTPAPSKRMAKELLPPGKGSAVGARKTNRVLGPELELENLNTLLWLPESSSTEKAHDIVPEWLRIMMGPYWQPSPDAARRIARMERRP